MPRTDEKRSWVRPAIVALVLLLLIAGMVAALWRDRGSFSFSLPQDTPTVESEQRSQAVVTRVVDGDTLHVSLDGADATIRLVGIDTPERGTNPPECYSEEATTWLRGATEGKRVFLERDPATDDRDRYGRLLRIVTVEGEATPVNISLVQSGAAEVYRRFPTTLRLALEDAEADARAARRGRWGACAD